MKTSDQQRQAADASPHFLHATGRFASAVPEVGACLSLGVRDGIRPGVVFTSVFAAVVAFGIWLTVFVVWRAEIWAMAGTAGRWMVFNLFALFRSDVSAGAASTLMTILWNVVNALLCVGSFALLVMLTIRLYLEFFLMARIQQQCLKRYPSLASNVKGSLRADMKSVVVQAAVLGGSLFLLLIPLVGGIIFFLLASYLNVRGLVNDALEGVATVDERHAAVKMMRVHMLLLGAASAAMLLIPLAGFFMPAVLGASVCHLCMRAVLALRASAPVA